MHDADACMCMSEFGKTRKLSCNCLSPKHTVSVQCIHAGTSNIIFNGIAINNIFLFLT